MSIQLECLELDSPYPQGKDVGSWNPPDFEEDLVPLLIARFFDITSIYAFDHRNNPIVGRGKGEELPIKGVWKTPVNQAKAERFQWLCSLGGYAGSINLIFQISIGPLIRKIINLWTHVSLRLSMKQFGETFLLPSDLNRLTSFLQAEHKSECVFLTSCHDFDGMYIFGSTGQLDLIEAKIEL